MPQPDLAAIHDPVPADYIASRIAEAVAEEREACALAAEGAMDAEGTDCPHQAIEWAAAAIRARGKQ